jgi:hypothetical protein
MGAPRSALCPHFAAAGFVFAAAGFAFAAAGFAFAFVEGIVTGQRVT